jgi:hypothetical protein
LAADDWTDIVRRNVGNELSALDEQHPGTAKATSGMFSSNKGSSGAIFESAPYTTQHTVAIMFNGMKHVPLQDLTYVTQQ